MTTKPKRVTQFVRDHLAGVMTLLAGVVSLGATAFITLARPQAAISFLQRFTSDGGLDDNFVYALQAIDRSLLYLTIALIAIGCVLLAIGDGRLRAWLARFLEGSPARILITLSLVSLGINALLIALVPYRAWADFEWYHLRAIDIASGRGLVSNDGTPTAFWPVGYSAFLAAIYSVFGAQIVFAQAANALLRIGMALTTYFVGRNLWGETVGVAGFTLVAFWPSLLFFTLVSGSDILFSLLFVLCALILSRAGRPTWRRSVALGIVIAFSAYVRPITLIFPAFVLIYWWIQTRNFVRSLVNALVVFAVMALIVAPWTYRNYVAFGRLVPISTNSGLNIFLGNNSVASGGFTLPPDFKQAVTRLDESAKDAYYQRLAVDYIAGHPLQTISVAFKKLFFLYARDDQGVSFATKVTYQLLPPSALGLSILVSDLYYYAVLGLCLWGFIGRRRITGMGRGGLLIGTSIAFVTISYLPFLTMDRYHMPVLFAFALLAARALGKPANALPDPAGGTAGDRSRGRTAPAGLAPYRTPDMPGPLVAEQLEQGGPPPHAPAADLTLR